jgi:NAD(P)-dependent dehydrogenase (short-subunit alcohol dehydrogenase family)
VRADVSRDEDAARLTKAAVERFGGVDILVNNAGIELTGLITETSEGDWARLMDVNLKGVFLCTKYAVPEMLRRGGGAIVNNSSINGIRGNTSLVAYAASKGGVVALTMGLAMDYARSNIRVNCVCPGTIETPMLDASLEQVPDAAAVRRDLVAKHPMGRLGWPDEVAHAILFFAGDEASFITGTTLAIDGGRSIR